MAADEQDVVLRSATPADDEFVASVYASTRAEELAGTGWSDEQKTAFCRMQFEAQTAHYRAHYVGAEQSIIANRGERAGRLYLHRGRADIRIMDVALLPAFRGHGIGTRLLRDLQTEARAARKKLSIHVERFNRARQLYERLGFREAEDKGAYVLMEWTADSSGSVST